MNFVFIREFLVEASPYLDATELALLNLEKEPSVISHASDAARSWRKLKSLATLFELQPVSTLAFQADQMLQRISTGHLPATENTINLLLGSLDLLVTLPETAQPGGTEPGERIRRQAELLRLQSTPVQQHGEERPPDPATLRSSILIVEDEPINQVLIAECIRKKSSKISIVSVDSAAEGLYWYMTHRFDLVFLDIMMPIIDGHHFLAIIEKNHHAGHLPFIGNIVVQTAVQSIKELTALARKDCILEIIRKPVLPARIDECLDRYCTGTGAGISAPPAQSP